LSKPDSIAKDSALAQGQGTSLPLNRYVWFFGLAIVGCLTDLLTKYWIFQWRGMPQANREWWIIPGFFGIETATNPGAVFGLGAGYSWLFAILSVGAAIAIPFWLFYRKAAKDLVLTLSLGSVMGGVFGNLYDRLGLWSPPGAEQTGICEVRDWILFRFGTYTWPNFNIADCLLVCGAGLLLYRAFFVADEPSVKK